MSKGEAELRAKIQRCYRKGRLNQAYWLETTLRLRGGKP